MSRNPHGCMIFLFALFWMSIVSVFDYLLLSGLARGAASLFYRSAPGVVLSSQVQEGTDSEGDRTYTPEVVYQYTVGGARLQGSRLRYGMNFGGQSRAARVVAEHPPGSTVTVFYSSQQPSESTLQRGTSGYELAMAMFLTPFNLIGLALGMAVFYRPSPANQVAEITVSESEREVRAALSPSYPWAKAAATLGMGTFFGIFVVLGGSLLLPTVLVSGVVWGAVLWLCYKEFRKGQQARAERQGDLVYLRHEKSLECWPLPVQDCHHYALSELRGLELLREESKDSDGDLVVDYCLVLELVNGAQLSLHKWRSEEAAESFRRWLAERVPFPQSETPIAAVEEDADWSGD